jgi:ubiquinone/menaquinone biosynthesis C-methylase UbiE
VAGTGPEPWWVTNYQTTAYVERFGHHDGEVTEREVAFLIEHAAIQRQESIVDLCCAFGRHLREFTRIGYSRTIGADLSAALLQFAIKSGLDLELSLRAVRADVRALPFRHVDVAMLLFGSFGFLETDESNQAVLAECLRILKPGGRFCMDFFTQHPDRMKTTERVVSTNNSTTNQLISYDPIGRRMIRHTTIQYAGSSQPVRTCSSVRLYTPEELLVMLRQVGLHVDALFGGYRGQELSETSDRVVIIGHKLS